MINNTVSAIINEMQAVVEDGAVFQCIENLWMFLSKNKNVIRNMSNAIWLLCWSNSSYLILNLLLTVDLLTPVVHIVDANLVVSAPQIGDAEL